MWVLEILLIGLALLGNVALWIQLFDLVHSRPMSRTFGRLLNVAVYGFALLLPMLLAVWYANGDRTLTWLITHGPISLPLAYAIVCWAMAIWIPLRRLWRQPADSPAVLTSNHTTRTNMLRDVGDHCVANPLVRRLARLPGNQLVDLAIHEKTLRIGRLPDRLEGLRIAHLSDLHFTGQIGMAYFTEVVRRTNLLQPDLVAVTGDLMDRAECMDWLEETLGRLETRYGAYFVLGNHDRRVDYEELRRGLVAHGLVNLGSRWQIVQINGEDVILAGNELPWFQPAADLVTCPPRGADGPLRIALSHSPDQFAWAREHDVDLLLAGHTHGGQIRLPLLGPLVASSRHGTRYASGSYYEPPTVLHVSRGLSQTTQIRFNCAPELALLRLTGASAS